MMNSVDAKNLTHEGNAAYIDTKQIDELLALFDMHNLMVHFSKHEHMFANSLAMLISSIASNTSNKNLFEALPFVKNREIDLLDILNTMAHLGYKNHEIDINIQDVDSRLMPCLFIPSKENAAPLILLNKKENILTAFNSKNKQVTEFHTKKIEGTAYFFEQIDVEATEENYKIQKSAGFSWFKVLFERFRPMLYEILLTSFFINLLAVAMPLFIMSVYDKIIGVGSTDTLRSFIIGIGIAIIAEFMLRMMRLKSIAWLGVRLDNIVSNTIFERLIFMKAINIEGASISAQIARIKSFESVRKFFTGPLFATIIELPFTVILLIAISFLTGPLVYIPLIVFAAFIILLYYYKPRLSIAMHRAATSSADRQQHSVETFIKMPTLQYNGMAENFWQRYKEKLSKSSIDIFTTNTISSVIDNIAHGVSLLSAVAIIHFGAHMVWDGSITIGALVATMLLFWRVLGPLQTLCSMLPRLEQLSHSINQINRLTAIEMERTYNIPRKSINHINGNVKLLNLGLRYQIDLEPVFFGLDIDVKPGELIAIVGANGTGKTSLLKLINGLYKSQTGTVLIDSTNIKQMDPIGLRSSIAYMPQSADFFEGTIKDNLLLVNPLATNAEILSALKQSRASEAIQELEKGIDTIIHPGDPILDLHLAHALNLARVYLKNSNLVLLDELPNYCLNEELGVAYAEFLKSAKGKKTVFFINNRNDYIKLADRVIVFRSRTKPVIMTSDSFINKYEQ